jgi:hypothetical protein
MVHGVWGTMHSESHASANIARLVRARYRVQRSMLYIWPLLLLCWQLAGDRSRDGVAQSTGISAPASGFHMRHSITRCGTRAVPCAEW